jgi:hypothetical protein
VDGDNLFCLLTKSNAASPIRVSLGDLIMGPFRSIDTNRNLPFTHFNLVKGHEPSSRQGCSMSAVSGPEMQWTPPPDPSCSSPSRNRLPHGLRCVR